MQNWKDLYKEHAQLITDKLPNIKWIDLWHNQVNFLTEEHPFPTPAVFLSYRTLSTEDTAKKVQKVNLQVDCYLYYETFADTYRESFNQESSLDFINLMDALNAIFHGTDGKNYSSMRRLSFAPVDTGNAGNLYRTSFSCVVMDYSALKNYEDHVIDDINIENSQTPYVVD